MNKRVVVVGLKTTNSTKKKLIAKILFCLVFIKQHNSRCLSATEMLCYIAGCCSLLLDEIEDNIK